MKTKLIIEIETSDSLNVWDDAEKCEEDYTVEELKKYRDEFCKKLHDGVVDYFQTIDEKFNDEFEDCSIMEEMLIEDWERAEDYGIKIKISKE